MRALGTALPGLSPKMPDRRPYPPGQHGGARRRKMSDFGKQLKEKQKLRFNYCIREKQMRRLFKEAKNSKMAADDKLLELLERRFDNFVFRAGFAPSIPAARQLVSHGHFKINGGRVNIPSYRMKEGDKVELREKSRKIEQFKSWVDSPTLSRPNWLSCEPNDFKASVDGLPQHDSVPVECDVQLVVEFYSKRL